MIKSLTVLAETAIVGGALAATCKSSIVKVEGTEGAEDSYYINKKKAALSTTAFSVGTALTYGIQEASFNKTLKNVENAQSYVESLSDEELEKALIAIGELEESNVLEDVATQTK